ncbi:MULTISPECIES: alkaline phosphatase family protein [unclassified Myroides]|uniref:alkaline phosphatase family protein n=1 Tax=unclassified Myroides TaxID=2642485 RepID=UPI003D2F7421
MKHVFFKASLLLMMFLHSVTSFSSESKKRKVLFVILDGIAYDMLSEKVSPTLMKIGKEGYLTKAYVGGGKDTYSQTPTVSAVGYNSLITGTWVNKHNVFGNSIKAPNYNYPTIFKLVKDLAPTKKIAVFSTWMDNRTKLIGEGLPQTNSLKMDYSFDGFELDDRLFPKDKQSDYIKEIDNIVVHRADEYIRKYAPDVSWVYLQYSDDIGHRFGDSPELNQAIAFEDELVKKLYAAVEYREEEMNEDWLFIVTTDHGRTAEDGKHHGGQTDRERSIWILSNKKELNNYPKAFEPSIVDILPTMLSFLNLEVEEEIKREFDGNNLYAPILIDDLKAQVNANQLAVSWEVAPEVSNEKGELWIATTNNVKEAGKDAYKLLKTVKLGDGKASVKLSKQDTSSFYKLYLKSEGGNLNTWISK